MLTLAALFATALASEPTIPVAPTAPVSPPVEAQRVDVLALQATGLTIGGLALGAHIYAFASDQSRVNAFVLPHVSTTGNILAATGTMLDSRRMQAQGLLANRWMGDAALTTSVLGHAPTGIMTALGGPPGSVVGVTVGAQSLAYVFNVAGVIDNVRVRQGGTPLLGEGTSFSAGASADGATFTLTRRW